MAGDRMDRSAVTILSTRKLEGLIVENALFEKYVKVVEDPSVTLLIARLAVIYRSGPDGEDVKSIGYSVRIERVGRSIEQSGPRKDWRNILDKALTFWIEEMKDAADVDPL